MITVSISNRLKHAATLMGIWYAVGLHLLWACLLFAGFDATLSSTALSGPAKLFPNSYGLGILLLTVASCALVGIYMRRINITKVMLLVPQQIMLGLSAFAALHAMVVSHYSDGVERPWSFIVADQAPAVFALLIHSATIVYLALLYEHHPAISPSE